MSKEELRRQIAELEEMFERNKLKRLIFTVLAFAAVFYYPLVSATDSSSLLTYLGCIPAALLAAGLYVYINILVFGHLCNKSYEENATLKQLQQQLKEME